MADFLKKMAQALKQYASDALPGGSLNPESQPVADRAKYMAGALDPSSQISQDLQGWHKRTQAGLTDQLAGKETPAAEYAYQQMMNMAGIAPVGMIAYHGSPHKFDKFSLDKIGTGEGAQAYGHGLYLAEHPETAKTYINAGEGVSSPTVIVKNAGGVDNAISQLTAIANDKARLASDRYSAKRLLKDVQGIKETGYPVEGNLYKTDIPDEAVARFLDWDKPLSQQAPEVLNSLKAAYKKKTGVSDRYIENEFLPNRSLNDAIGGGRMDQSLTQSLIDHGVPGLKYLDGGSRGGGAGTSNYVVFDPEMIRILERNGQSTGQSPWSPGEYQNRLRSLLEP